MLPHPPYLRLLRPITPRGSQHAFTTQQALTVVQPIPCLVMEHQGSHTGLHYEDKAKTKRAEGTGRQYDHRTCGLCTLGSLTPMPESVTRQKGGFRRA